MLAILESDRRPEAMADVPGACELPLTRAIVQYRDVHEIDLAGGRLQDIGLALVLEGRYASSAEVVDLGSATVKLLDLSAELVVLDWVYEPTLDHVGTLLRSAASRAAAGRSVPGADPAGEAGWREGVGEPEAGTNVALSRRAAAGVHAAAGGVSSSPSAGGGTPARPDPLPRAGDGELGRFCFRTALRVLERVGFGPLTRPTLLRIGFRDVCSDIDLHEATSVRIVAGEGRIVRAHLDYDANALVFRTGGSEPEPVVETALREAFPHGDLRRLVPAEAGALAGYHVRFPFPLTLEEARSSLSGMRRGLLHLIARFEPERYRTVERMTGTFGARDTLAALHLPEPRIRYAPVGSRLAQGGPVVH